MSKNILVIRRDNIGDLICTTPLISSLRRTFPDACIDVLVNSYNAPVVRGNKEIDNIYLYKKAKHTGKGESKLKVYLERFSTYLKLRLKGIDVAILAGGEDNKRSLKVAKIVGAKEIIGYTSSSFHKGITTPLPAEQTKGLHEVELTNFLANSLGITGQPPKCTLIPDDTHLKEAEKYLQASNITPDMSPIGLHISARKPSNRWTEDGYIELIQKLWRQYQQPIVLFWSPGSQNNPLHPGDDELADRIKKSCQNVELTPFPTQSLEQLITGVSLCREFICSDGGAMHIAAALGRPILCFFGDSDATRWHPWGTRYELIQKESRQVSDITVDEALNGFSKLLTGY
ncbi:glycosyltransferase family 9 protein [Endozoicomonas sp. ALE010]|uniref:glycosyltransferase family 9 protein n=1 Tax=Endozoicomonas sp. ALE010 TaxID=3403081 RepID=UPI003BB4E273